MRSRSPEVVDEVEDLGLDGHVERGGRLVGDEQLGLAGQGHGDHDPLAQAPRELVGVVVQALGGPGHVHQGEHLEGPVPGLGLGDVAVQSDALGDLLADGHGRVERRHRVLEDQAHLVAPHLAHLLLAQGGQVTAQQGDLARRSRARRWGGAA